MSSSVIESMCLMCRAWAEKNEEKQLRRSIIVFLAFSLEKSEAEWEKFSEEIIAPIKDLALSDSLMAEKYYAKHMLMLSKMTEETYSDILEEISKEIIFAPSRDKDWVRYGKVMVPLMAWFDDEFKKGEKHE